MRAAARMRTAKPPIAMPTIAPTGREEDLVATGEVELEVAGGAVGAAVAPV
jgi:hypothetical protein